MVTGQLHVKMDEIRQIAAFTDMPLSQLNHLVTLMVRQTFVPGELIFIEGEPSRSLWFVFEGRVKIIKQSVNGRIQGLCLMNRGKCFGSCPLFDMAKNPATAQALDTVTLFVIPGDDLEQLKTGNPLLVKALLRIYSQRLEHLARVSEVLGSWTVADRINDCLLLYLNRDAPQPFVALTHEKLADLSGTVREVVTRHLSLLEQEGIVHNETGRILVLNSDALVRPCGTQASV